MGKVRINTIGDESLEQEQKIKAEKRKEAKSHTPRTKADQSLAEKTAESSEVKHEEKETKISEKKVATKPAVPVVEASQTKKAKRSKKYQSVANSVDKNKLYTIADALDILPQIHLAKFDETVELHVNTYTTGVSGSVTLPHGTGKQVRVAILSPNKDAKAADELLQNIEAGIFNFDILIATPDAMPRLAKVARILGPRGLMPNPKNGTVTAKPDEVAKQYQGGQVNFKTESKAAVIHLSVGKLSFKKEQLQENITTALQAVQNKNIKNVTLKSTMSPGIRIQLS